MNSLELGDKMCVSQIMVNVFIYLTMISLVDVYKLVVIYPSLLSSSVSISPD